MENAKQHWKILQGLDPDLANRVRSFMVIGDEGNDLMVATKDGLGFWFRKMLLELGEWKTATKPTQLDVLHLVQMAQSQRHILLLNKLGDIYSIEKNDNEQLGLGINDKEARFSPQLIPSLHKFISIRCGHKHILALTEDSKVFAWGENYYGQVGVSSLFDPITTPRKIFKLDFYRVIAVECGGHHSLALTDLGEVYGWGRNVWGQLGDGSNSSKYTPTQIPIPTPVKSMAAGSRHTLLLTQTGEVWACGFNGYGQLGLRSITVFSLCLSKVKGLPPISQIVSHNYTNLSIAMSTKQRCFIWGQMADETFIFTPRELSLFYSTVESPLSFFSTHHNTPYSITIPETLPYLSVRMSRMFDNPETSDVQFVVEQRTIHAHRIILSNSSDYFARMFDKAWLPQNDSKYPIVKVTILDHSYQIFHAFLQLLYNFEVQSDFLPDLFKLAIKYLVPDLQQLCLSLMRITITTATCCLYYPLTQRHSHPELATFQQELVQFASTRMSEVVHSDAYQSMELDLRENLTKAVQNFQSSWCKVFKHRQRLTEMNSAILQWPILQKLGTYLANRVRQYMVIGENGNEVLVATKDGLGIWLREMLVECKTVIKQIPLHVPGLIQMAQSQNHILLLNKLGDIYSIEKNDAGQLGQRIDDKEVRILPELIPSTHKFISVRCGNLHSLALTEDGKVWAWGVNYCGQVGVPNLTKFFRFPRQISELDSYRVVAVECGRCHSLALTDQGKIYAWGMNYWGQLGDGSETFELPPTQISTPSPVKSMAAGDSHTLLLTQTGEVYACGGNGWGQLGYFTTTVSNLCLFKVKGLPPISQIASHPLANLSIAMSSDQRYFVWGEMRNEKLEEMKTENSIYTPLKLPSFYSTVESLLSFYSTHRSTPHSVSIPVTPLSPLSARMSRMFDNIETSDVQFVVEQRTIHAHRIILSNSSDYFATLFSEKWPAPVDPKATIVKVTIPDYSYEIFHAFLLFLYTDCFEIHFDLLPELFKLASQYLVPDLQQLCLSRMRTTLTPTTCCLYYQLTNRYYLPVLSVFQQELVQFASTRMSEIADTGAYQLMESDLRDNLTNAVHNFLWSGQPGW